MATKRLFTPALLLGALLLSAGAVALGQESAPTLLDDGSNDANGAKAAPAATAPRAVETDTPEASAPDVGAATAPKAHPALPENTGPSVPKPKLTPGVDPSRPPPKPILTPKVGDDDILAAWGRWRTASAELDGRTSDAAQQDLLRLRQDLGVSDLENISTALIRASESRRSVGDPQGAVQLATTALQLSPELPYAYLGLADAVSSNSAFHFSPGAYVSEAIAAARILWSDPRYQRPALADVGTCLLAALIATAAIVVLVLFARRLRYFLHDVHHFFPRSAARWQSAALVFLLLALPVIFRLGLLPTVTVLFAAVTLYLGLRERLLGALLIAALGLVPLAAGYLAQKTTFAGTPAEDVYLLEHGGLDAKAASLRVKRRLADDNAEFQEIFALARYEARRGDLDDAISHYKKAADLRQNDARLFTNMANAMLIRGDTEGAAELYQTACQADPSLAAPWWNIAKLYYRRASIMNDEAVGLELDKAQTAITTAQHLDESLLTRHDPQDNYLGNRLLISPPLARGDVLELADLDVHAKVANQLSAKLVGAADANLGALLAAGFALGLIILGGLRGSRRISRACEKCGRAVCRRCDPELGIGSKLCNQCVHVFARANVVAPSVKVKKQLEIRHYESRMNRIASVLGLLGSGVGHLFSGLPLRGAAYLFVFLFALCSLVLRQGVLRAPYGPAPLWFRVLPAALLLITIYSVSLLTLLRKRAS